MLILVVAKFSVVYITVHLALFLIYLEGIYSVLLPPVVNIPVCFQISNIHFHIFHLHLSLFTSIHLALLFLQGVLLSIASHTSTQKLGKTEAKTTLLLNRQKHSINTKDINKFKKIHNHGRSLTHEYNYVTDQKSVPRWRTRFTEFAHHLLVVDQPTSHLGSVHQNNFISWSRDL